MLILLPPSETKIAGGEGAPLDLGALSFADELREARERAMAAVAELSRDADAAAKSLKLGVKNRHEAERNLELETSATMPAIQRYTGVLYDALGYEKLSKSAQDWVHEHVFIQSALFGLLRASDMIPAYRLSASSRLPELGLTLRKLWERAHQEVLEARLGGAFVLDARSKEYGALAPLYGSWFLEVVQRNDDGRIIALNHFNKADKGKFVAQLAESGAEIREMYELLAWAGEHGVEISVDHEKRTVTLVTALEV